ncbi:MAG: DUF2975 domain-containing protein [Coriobacteriales bacterium]|jgi:hypothetical protein|nr:DUF2975 domain-containing protein [Coriobacteriales bacterium]
MKTSPDTTALDTRELDPAEAHLIGDAPAPEQVRVRRFGVRLRRLVDFATVLTALAALFGLIVICYLIWGQLSGQSGSGAFSGIVHFLTLAGLPLGAETRLPILLITLVYELGYSLVILAILCSARRVLAQTVSSLTPFSHEQSHRLRRLAWLAVVLAGAILVWLLLSDDPLVGSATSFHFAEFFAPAEDLVIALLFFFLAYVFDYGALLQEQSDQTV